MTDSAAAFARRVFTGAAIYGFAALLPQYFLEEKLGRDFPPPVTHPEHFYGFLGVALAWQAAFLVIARDPVRFRPFMLVGIVEKVSFGAAALVLWQQGRVPGLVAALGGLDLVLAALFFAAWRRTPAAHGE